MRALFNGTCERCKAFRPRCARVYLRVDGKATQFRDAATVLCDVCRKERKGRFRVDERHR